MSDSEHHDLPAPSDFDRRLDDRPFDRQLLSRLLVGALGDSEQRSLFARLLRCDGTLRATVAEALAALADPHDAALVARYDAALDAAEDQAAAEDARARLLAEGRERFGAVETLLDELTVGATLDLDSPARHLFTWTHAEQLLERAGRDDLPEPAARAALHLGRTAIDVLGIFDGAGLRPLPPRVRRALTSRAASAARRLGAA